VVVQNLMSHAAWDSLAQGPPPPDHVTPGTVLGSVCTTNTVIACRCRARAVPCRVVLCSAAPCCAMLCTHPCLVSPHAMHLAQCVHSKGCGGVAQLLSHGSTSSLTGSTWASPSKCFQLRLCCVRLLTNGLGKEGGGRGGRGGEGAEGRAGSEV
jgi:hypothetical protein